jgi:SAM-dependent methyltransferase
MSEKKLEYSTDYYASIQADSARSAKEVAPLIYDLVQPESLVDVGCGSGTWTRAFKEAGVKKILGIDGHYVRDQQLLIDPSEFQRHDLTQRLQVSGKFDLVVSLEVAEHLPASRAKSFVADLCALGGVVLFSAAVPGQGGTHHINEQWPTYWNAFFAENKFKLFDIIRPLIWQNNNVAWWYRQNMFLFVRQDMFSKFPWTTALPSHAHPLDMVHPQAYVTATVPSAMSPRMIKEVIKALPYFPAKVRKHLRKS